MHTRTIGLLGILLLGVLPLVTDVAIAAEPAHRSTGLIVALDHARGTVVMKDEGHRHVLRVAPATALRDDSGGALRGIRGLQVGDYVREDCVRDAEGAYVARRIEVLRPAWKLAESPEH